MDTPFNERGVSVTRNALSAAGQVFPLREIQSVRIVTVQKNRILPVSISVIGVIVAIIGGVTRSSAGLVCGAMLAVVGWLTWATQDVTHRLHVTTATGEREALLSTDLEFVQRVEQYVNDALAAAATAAASAAAAAAAPTGTPDA
ncbi:DUF6232 family protein [Paraburkholderia sp.]|uniref:DUF6232 family protein n=1 Tax=Paraburkholderia sp. TaxID=1926495 RepID=UPI0023A0EB7A|nr:DUF6232 family protein [Paraburkholderia sp.]MDE1179713.1 DUF6232 family protein [Paraburkholderia sp.]